MPPWLAEKGVTLREAEVLDALRDHRSNAELAAALGISIRTVESHISSLLSKLGAISRTDLVKLAHGGGAEWRSKIALPPFLVTLCARGPFIGRDLERGILRRAWEQAAAGHQQLVLVTGEAGIGKSRLTAELALEVGLGGALVLYGRCDEEQTAPYQPVAEALVAYVHACPEPVLESQLGGLRSELGRLVPGLLRDVTPDLDLFQTNPEMARYRLFEAVRLLVRGAAADAPLLIVLDDIHWASRPTLLLLRHIARALEPIPVMIVASFRDTDIGTELSDFLADVRRNTAAETLSLVGLNAIEMGELVSGTSTAVASNVAWAGAIHAETNGNPFFAVELVRHLQESGKPGPVALHVPASVREVVELRVRRLSDETERVLRIASVLGDEFELSTLREIADLDDTAVLDALEDATAAGLIHEVADNSVGLGVANLGDERYRFNHAIVRKTLVEQLSAARRRRLHADAARILDTRQQSDGRRDRDDEIAHHLLQGGNVSDPGQTLKYLVRAGQAAIRSAGFEEALRLCQQGLALTGQVHSQEQAELLFQMGVAQRSLGLWDDAIMSWRRSLDVFTALEDVEAVGRVCEAASYNLSWAMHPEDAIAIARKGLRALSDRRSPERGRLLGVFACVSAWAGLYGESARAVDEVRELADQLDDELLLGHALAAETMQRTAFMEHREAAEAGTRAAEILRRHGDLWNLASVLGFLQVALVGLGRLDDARRVSDEVRPLAERLGNYGALSQATRMDAITRFFEDGDPTALDAFARRDLEFCRAIGIGLADHSQGWLGFAKFLKGDWSGAEPELREALRMELGTTAMAGWAWAFLFDLVAYSGDGGSVAAMLDARSGDLPHPGQPNRWGSWVMLLSVVEGLAMLGERDRASTYYPVLLDGIARTGAVCMSFRDGRLLERVAGIAAAAGGNWSAAQRHFEIALHQARTLPHRVEEAHTLRFTAQMFLDRAGSGDQTKAQRFLSAAGDHYRELGMAKHLELVHDLEASL